MISQGEEEDITIMRNKAFIWIFFIYFGILSFLHFFLTNNFYMVKFVPHFILTFSL
jgi:polyferredoxin